MQTLVIFVAVVYAVSAQQGMSKAVASAPPLILMQTSMVNPDGSFQYSFETENGIRASESGYLKNPGTPNEAQTVQGSYSYTAPDGTPITVTYTADENGFKAMGDHLPVAPEIPALIAKALAYNAANAGVERGDQIQARPTPRPKSSATRRLPGGASRVGFASGTEI